MSSPKKQLPPGVTLADFYAFMPKHQYIFAPTGDLWPAASINARLPAVPLLKKDGTAVLDDEGNPKSIKPATWLDRNRPVEQMSWAPGEPEAIHGKLATKGGWIERDGVTTFNLYQPPIRQPGNPAGAARWLALGRRIYPNSFDRIATFCAHRAQKPEEKINHATVMTGSPGIGKDTLLEPLKYAVGPWNFKEASPHNIVDKNNDYMCSTVLRVSEMRDLGEINRFAFYEKMKTIIATPPDMTRINTKYVPEYYIPNLTAVIDTSNYPSDGLYLPPDDRRHDVHGTEITKEDFEKEDPEFWPKLWAWYAAGGIWDVVAYLSDPKLLIGFDPKKPPEKTAAFWRMADSGVAAEVPELRDALELIGKKDTCGKPVADSNGNPAPPDAVTLAMVLEALERPGDEVQYFTGKSTEGLHAWLKDPKNWPAIKHRFDSCGYVPVRNPGTNDGFWVLSRKRVVVYARTELGPAGRLKAAEALKADVELKAKEAAEKAAAEAAERALKQAAEKAAEEKRTAERLKKDAERAAQEAADRANGIVKPNGRRRPGQR